MIVCDNGVYRPPTEEELAAWKLIPAPDTSEAEKAEAYDILIGDIT